jgi:hypothetical protein
MKSWIYKLSDCQPFLCRHSPVAYDLLSDVPATATEPARKATPDDIKARAIGFNGPQLGFLCAGLDSMVRNSDVHQDTLLTIF